MTKARKLMRYINKICMQVYTQKISNTHLINLRFLLKIPTYVFELIGYPTGKNR